MPFQRPTLQDIAKRVQADFAVQMNEGKPLRARTLPSVLAHSIAGVSHMIHGHLEYLSQQIFPDTCTTENLERMAMLRGLERTPASFAQGKVEFTGNAGSPIAAGTEINKESVVFTVNTAGVVPCLLKVTAQTPGTAGNTAIGTAITHQIAGVTDAIVRERIHGGFEIESHNDLLMRYVLKLKHPTRGGTKRDYEAIGLELPGVKTVWVYEGKPNPGEVGITFIMKDMYSPIPSDDQIAEMKAHLEPRKPLLAKLNVFALQSLF